MEGMGIFIWPDKKKYIGQYKNDKKCGYGIFIWPDNRKYEGEWKNGKQHGYGFFYSKGARKFGEWVNGKKERWLSDEDSNANRVMNDVDKFIKSNFVNNPSILSTIKNEESEK
jgi:hypothetical protein